MIRQMIAQLEEILFPSGVQCICCSDASHGALLCRNCQRRLREKELKEHGNPCSCWTHGGEAAALVHMLKFEGIHTAAQVLAEGIAQSVPSLPPSTVVTWVPASPKRMKERGIDHGRVLAEQTAKALNLPVQGLLQRQGERHTQLGLTRSQRLTNLVGAFVLTDTPPASVLLVDDVMTTGATSAECVKILQAGGAVHVQVATATRAHAPEGGSPSL